MINRIFVIVNHFPFYLSHRRDVLQKVAAYFRADLRIVTPRNEAGDQHHIIAPYQRDSLGPISILLTALQALSLAIFQKKAVFHLITIIPIILYGPFLRLCNRPTIIAITGFGTAFSKNYRLGFLRKILVALYRFIANGNYALVIVQNEQAKVQMSEWGIKESNICLIKGSGVSPDRYPFLPKTDLGTPIRILVPARLIREKGIFEAVQVIERLSESVTSTIELRFAGGIDEGNPLSLTKDDIDSIKSRLGSRVRFLGHVESMFEEFNQADIVLFPSYHEGLPRALIEAFAIGRPVVAFDVIGVNEIVTHESTGLLAPLGDIDGMTTQLRRLIENRDLRLQLVNEAHRFFTEELTLEAITSKTIAAYSLLLDRLKN